MSKQKTHKGIKNRFKVTGGNKVKYRTCGSSHRNSVSNGAKTRQRRQMKTVVTGGPVKRLSRALNVKVQPSDKATPRTEAASA